MKCLKFALVDGKWTVIDSVNMVMGLIEVRAGVVVFAPMSTVFLEEELAEISVFMKGLDYGTEEVKATAKNQRNKEDSKA